jgi:hypothetical protein
MTTEDRLDRVHEVFAAQNGEPPTRESFRAIAMVVLGLTREQFDAWASGKQWRK